MISNELRGRLFNRWTCALLCISVLLFVAWPRYEFRTEVISPDGEQGLMVYVRGGGLFDLAIGAPGDWAYSRAYAILVDDEGRPIGRRIWRRCAFLIGDLYNGMEYRADWSGQTVEIAKFSVINRETGRAECRI